MKTNNSYLKKNYSHYISLGHFCSVAMELERYGLRSASMPFDWLITDFRGVMNAINRDFKDLFDEAVYSQSSKQLYCYKNMYYDFEFVHDFSKYKTLHEQFRDFQEKYTRRIDRFYKQIAEPTLFIRYIKNPSELDFIKQNKDYVFATIKKFNPQNDICFIANEGISSNSIDIYNVTPDEKDYVARKFFEKK